MTNDARADRSAEENLADNYAAAGYGHELEWGTRPALIVIDVCAAYVEPSSPLYAGVEAEVESTARLVDVARAGGVPVIFTRVEFQSDGADGGVFFRKVPALASFTKGNPLAEFLERPAPLKGEVVVTKQYASAFFGTSLAATLVSQGIDTLLITGLSTSGCVRATAVDALQHGFIPVVIRDAVGDRHDGPHEANLFDLQAKYAVVTGEPEATEYMDQRS